MKVYIIPFIGSVMSFFSADVLAQVTEKPAPIKTVSASAVSHSGYLTQVFFGLILVVALIFIVAWLLKRVGHGSFASGQQMKLLASMPLGTRERLLLVDIAGQQLLLGVAPGRISTLHTFAEPVIDIPNKTGDLGGLGSEFSSKLRDLMSGQLAAKAPNKSATVDSDIV